MIAFDADGLFEELAALAHREGYAAQFDRTTMVRVIAEAIAEARSLAAGHPEQEVAAVFHAFGRRSITFRPVARRFVDTLLHAQAVATGFELEMTEAEFAILCARIALHQIELPELHSWIAPRLRPLGQTSKRRPPKRPR